MSIYCIIYFTDGKKKKRDVEQEEVLVAGMLVSFALFFPPVLSEEAERHKQEVV